MSDVTEYSRPAQSVVVIGHLFGVNLDTRTQRNDERMALLLIGY